MVKLPRKGDSKRLRTVDKMASLVSPRENILFLKVALSRKKTEGSLHTMDARECTEGAGDLSRLKIFSRSLFSVAISSSHVICILGLYILLSVLQAEPGNFFLNQISFSFLFSQVKEGKCRKFLRISAQPLASRSSRDCAITSFNTRHRASITASGLQTREYHLSNVWTTGSKALFPKPASSTINQFSILTWAGSSTVL